MWHRVEERVRLELLKRLAAQKGATLTADDIVNLWLLFREPAYRAINRWTRRLLNQSTNVLERAPVEPTPEYIMSDQCVIDLGPEDALIARHALRLERILPAQENLPLYDQRWLWCYHRAQRGEQFGDARLWRWIGTQQRFFVRNQMPEWRRDLWERDMPRRGPSYAQQESAARWTLTAELAAVGSDAPAVRKWMYRVRAGYRHLTDDQRVYLAKLGLDHRAPCGLWSWNLAFDQVDKCMRNIIERGGETIRALPRSTSGGSNSSASAPCRPTDCRYCPRRAGGRPRSRGRKTW